MFRTADVGEDVRILDQESEIDYAEAEEDWKDKALKLFAAIGLAAKGDVKLLVMGIKQGDIASLKMTLTTRYGNRSRASRFQPIMSFMRLSLSSMSDLETHVS